MNCRSNLFFLSFCLGVRCKSGFINAVNTIESQSSDKDIFLKTLNKAKFLSRGNFTKILHTSLDDEVTLQHIVHRNHDNGSKHLRARRNERRTGEIKDTFDEDDAWQVMLHHGWAFSKSFESRRHHRNLRPDGNNTSSVNVDSPSTDDTSDTIHS